MFKCDCFAPTPIVDGDGDTVCRVCKRVLRIGPFGLNRFGARIVPLTPHSVHVIRGS